LKVVESSDETETVYLLGLESHEPDPTWSYARHALDGLIRHFQPSPVLTHVELLMVPPTKGGETHFSTYMGHAAGWGSSFADGSGFYLGRLHINSWRAIPVQGKLLAKSLKRACGYSVKAPYSLTRYAFSIPPGRALAALLSDGPMSPAHCAGLAARLLREASTDVVLPHSSPWYAPSTLFIELSKRSRMEVYAARQQDLEHKRSIVEEEETSWAVETLLRGSDMAVITQQHHISKQVIAQRAAGYDPVRERILEKQLARALVRFAELGN
jgi:hypothetical protein